MAENKTPPKDYNIKHATFYNTLDNDIGMASFNGRLVIGPTTLNNESEMVFEPYRTITLLPSNYFKFVECIKKARIHFTEKPDDNFEIDLIPNKNSMPRFKLTASFGKWSSEGEGDEQNLFQIRQKWNYTKDKNYNENVELGLQDPIVQSDPYRYVGT